MVPGHAAGRLWPLAPRRARDFFLLVRVGPTSATGASAAVAAIVVVSAGEETGGVGLKNGVRHRERCCVEFYVVLYWFKWLSAWCVITFGIT